MPTTTPGAHGTDPFEQARLAGRELLRLARTDHHDVLVVLGTGLAGAAELLGAEAEGPPIDLTTLPWFPRFTGTGQRPAAWSLDVAGVRSLVVAGRLHLYEGHTPVEVVHMVRVAMATGCRTILLTGSVEAIDRSLSVGQVVAVADHLDLTGTSPLTAVPADHPHGIPFVDLGDAWSPRLRALARRVAPSLAEGVYAQVTGPHLETPAEIRMLATLGADLVGTSMVPEAIAARHLGGEVLGLTVVTRAAVGAGRQPVDRLVQTAEGATDEVARLVRGVITGLGDDTAPDPAGEVGRATGTASGEGRAGESSDRD